MLVWPPSNVPRCSSGSRKGSARVLRWRFEQGPHRCTTERAQDWADIDLIVGRLRECRDLDAGTEHLFGNALVEELLANRQDAEYCEALLRGQQADERPILRLGLTASVDDLRAMARAEQRFWEVAGALRSDEIRDALKVFWRKHASSIRAGKNFSERHASLLAAAQSDLSLSPIKDPIALIDKARTESGTDRWPQLLPASSLLSEQYFPERRSHLAARLHSESLA